jgi:hypothetical protein
LILACEAATNRTAPLARNMIKPTSPCQDDVREMPPRNVTKSPLARRLLGAAVMAVLLAPAAWTRQTCADDWADETSPTDNPETPGPDLYPNKRFEDGVQSMPDLLQSMPALDVLEVLPTGHSPFFAEVVHPSRVSFKRLFSVSPRAPPASPAV